MIRMDDEGFTTVHTKPKKRKGGKSTTALNTSYHVINSSSSLSTSSSSSHSHVSSSPRSPHSSKVTAPTITADTLKLLNISSTNEKVDISGIGVNGSAEVRRRVRCSGPFSATISECRGEQKNEISALESIFEADFYDLREDESTNMEDVGGSKNDDSMKNVVISFSLRLTIQAPPLGTTELLMHVTFPPFYPEDLPDILLESVSSGISLRMIQDLTDAALKKSEEYKGQPMMYDISEFIKEKLTEAVSASSAASAPGPESRSLLSSSSSSSQGPTSRSSTSTALAGDRPQAVIRFNSLSFEHDHGKEGKGDDDDEVVANAPEENKWIEEERRKKQMSVKMKKPSDAASFMVSDIFDEDGEEIDERGRDIFDVNASGNDTDEIGQELEEEGDAASMKDMVQSLQVQTKGKKCNKSGKDRHKAHDKAAKENKREKEADKEEYKGARERKHRYDKDKLHQKREKEKKEKLDKRARDRHGAAEGKNVHEQGEGDSPRLTAAFEDKSMDPVEKRREEEDAEELAQWMGLSVFSAPLTVKPNSTGSANSKKQQGQTIALKPLGKEGYGKGGDVDEEEEEEEESEGGEKGDDDDDDEDDDNSNDDEFGDEDDEGDDQDDDVFGVVSKQQTVPRSRAIGEQTFKNESDPTSEFQQKEKEREELLRKQSRYLADFRQDGILGKGGFGEVYKVYKHFDDAYYAVKKIKMSTSRALNKKIKGEIATIRLLNHPYIVRYYQSWEEDGLDVLGDEEEDEDDEDWMTTTTTLGAQDQHDDDNDDEDDDDDDNDTSDFEDDDGQFDDDDDEAYGNNATTATRGAKKAKEKVWKMDRKESLDVVHEIGGRKICKFLYIQMEYCANQTLRDLIDDMDFLKTPDNCWKLFQQILEAISYMHKRGVIHRDLKPANIFISDEANVKIGDFGLAVAQQTDGNEGQAPGVGPDLERFSIYGRNRSGSNTVVVGSGGSMGVVTSALVPTKPKLGEKLREAVGTLMYAAPEQAAQDMEYDAKADMFAIGIIFFEMWRGPYSSESEKIIEISALRKAGRLPDNFRPYSSLASVEDVNKVAEIVRLLLAADPNDRPSAQDLLNSGKVPLKIEDERMEQVLQSLITSTSKGPFHARLLDTLFSTSATREEDLTYDHLAGRRNLRANDQAYNQVFKLSSLTVAKSMLHSLVIERLTRCFRSHGAVRIVTPLLMPKTGLTKSGKNTAYVLDQAGMLLQLPYTQTVPFARYVAQNYVREGLLTASKKQISMSSSSSSLSSSLSSTKTSTIYVDLKRFDFSPVYRQRYSFSPRMLGECNFDIVWAQPKARAIIGAATQDATSATVIATATPLTTITVSSSGSFSGQAEPGQTADVATALTLVTEREEKAKEKAALLTAEVVKAGRDALEAFSHVLGPVRIRVSHWWVFEAVLDVVMLSHCAHVLAERQALPGLSSSLSADMLGAEDNATEKDKGGLVQEAKVPRLPGPEGEKKLGHSTSIDSLSNYFFSSRSMDGFTSSVSADPLAEGFSSDGFPVTQAGSTLPRLTILSSKRLLQQVAFLRSQIRALAGTVRLTSAVQWTKSTVRRQLFSEKRLHPKALEVLGLLLVPLSSEAMDAATTEKEAERFLVSFESSVHQELESGMIDVLVKTLAVMKAHSSSPVTTTGSGTGGRVDVAASIGDASISAVNDDFNGASGGWRTRSAHFQAWKDLAPTVGGLEGLLHLPAAIDALRRLFRCLARMNVPAHMDLSLASPNEVYRAGTFFQIVSISNNAGGSGDHPGHLKPSLARRTSLTNATDAENVLAIGGRYDFLLNRFAAAESDASSVSLCGAGVNLAFDKIVNQLMLRHEAVGEAEMATMALGWPPHPSDHPHTRQRYHHQHQQRVGANSGVLQQKGPAKAHAQQHVHSSSSSSNSSSNSSGSGSGSNSNNSNNSSGSSGGSGSISTALIDVDSELPPSLALQTAGVLLFCLRGELLDVRLKVCAQLWFHSIHCDYLFPDSLKTPAEVRAFALERGMRYLVLFERASFKLKGDMKVKVTDLFVTISGVPKYKTDEEAAAGKKEKKSSKGGWHGHAVEAVVDTVVMPSASVCAYIMSKLQASGQHGSWCFAHRGVFGEEVEGLASGDRDADGGGRWSTGGGRSYSQLHGEGTNDEDGAGGGRGSVARKGDGYRDKVSASFLALDEQNVKIMWTKRPDARGDKNEKADKHRNSMLTAKLRNLLSPLLRAYNTVSGCPYAVVACELTILMLKAVSSFFYSSQRSKGPLHNEAILKQIYGKDADQIPKAQKLMVCDLVNHVSNVLSQDTFVKFVILFSITDEKTDILTV